MARISTIGTDKKLKVQFNSVPEVFRTIQRMGWTPQRSKSSDDRGRGGDFYTFSSLAEANDVFLNHPERIRGFSQNDDKLSSVDSPGKDVEFDVTGDFLDIDRYLEGIPEVFGNAVMGNPKSVFCTINVLDAMVSYTDKKYAIAKQKRILRLVDWLESQSIRCQVVTSEDSNILSSEIVVKEFSEHFDLNQLAVALHPDFFRRVIFLIMEQSNTWSYGYGNMQDYDSRMKNYKPQPEDGMYVYVGGYIPFGGPDNGITQLEKSFDTVEENIQKAIDDGLSWSETPLIISGGSGW